MAYVISDDCISCGTCEGECPVGAISMGADHYEIDPYKTTCQQPDIVILSGHTRVERK